MSNDPSGCERHPNFVDETYGDPGREDQLTKIELASRDIKRRLAKFSDPEDERTKNLKARLDYLDEIRSTTEQYPPVDWDKHRKKHD